MESGTIEVLDPTVQPAKKQALHTPCLPRLEGKLNISFFWNSKPNGDLLLLNVKERLNQEYPHLIMPWFQKEQPSAASDISTTKQVAANADLVIIATAD